MKYPRTPHVPQSPGGTNEDRRLVSLDTFLDRPLVVTEKMDGSNVCLQNTGCFARSHSHPPHHASFDMFKAFHARVQSKIPPNLQIFGEWCYAKHSIIYTALPSYFMIFGVRDMSKMLWASWGEVELWADELGVPTAPYLLSVEPGTDLEKVINTLASENARPPSGHEREGFVIRWADEFHDDEFPNAVAKWVRADHVQTPFHWKNLPIVRNRLAVESPVHETKKS